jgi:hypothetical protein
MIGSAVAPFPAGKPIGLLVGLPNVNVDRLPNEPTTNFGLYAGSRSKQLTLALN